MLNYWKKKKKTEWLSDLRGSSEFLGDEIYKTICTGKKKGCICMTMILNYVVQCSWCWSVGKKKSSLMWEGSIHCFLENAVKFNHGITSSVSSSHLYFCSWFLIAVFYRHKVFCFACFACLTAKKKKKKLNFWLWRKAEKKMLGFLNVQKAIVLVKLLTVSWVFLNCWTKAAYRWHILYQRWRN